MDFDWSKYCDIEFTPQSDDSLFILADLALPKSGVWYLTVGAPQITYRENQTTH